MKIYGLSLGEISIIVSLLTTMIILVGKISKWLISKCIEYYTLNNFKNIKSELLEINDKIEELDKDIKCIKQQTMTKKDHTISCNNCKEELEDMFVTKEELNQISQRLLLLNEQINNNYNRMLERIDNFLLTFINKGK